MFTSKSWNELTLWEQGQLAKSSNDLVETTHMLQAVLPLPCLRQQQKYTLWAIVFKPFNWSTKESRVIWYKGCLSDEWFQTTMNQNINPKPNWISTCCDLIYHSLLFSSFLLDLVERICSIRCHKVMQSVRSKWQSVPTTIVVATQKY